MDKYSNEINCLSKETKLTNKSAHTDQEPMKIKLVSEEGKILIIAPRELQCLKLLAHGRRAKEIADNLGISKRTVEGYLRNLKNKASGFFYGPLPQLYWTYFKNK